MNYDRNGSKAVTNCAQRLYASRSPEAFFPRGVRFVAAGAGLVDALLAQRLLAPAGGPGRAVQGIVVAATGNGTVHMALAAALQRAQAAGVRIWVTTRCAQGQVAALPAAPFEVVGLPPVKARIALQLALLPAGQAISPAPRTPGP